MHKITSFMSLLHLLLDRVRAYVEHMNALADETGFAPYFSFRQEYVCTTTWHEIIRHSPPSVYQLRELVYVFHDESEIIYVGETKKTLSDRLCQHYENSNEDMIGPWMKEEHFRGVLPRALPYRLRRLEQEETLDLMVTAFPTKEVFGLTETESDFMNEKTKAFERYLIDDLNPLLNGDGPAEVMLRRYEKYLRWHGERERLKHVVVKGACTICIEVGSSNT